MSGPVLVIGGGLAGMSSALHLADAGQPVYLIDDAPFIGGSLLLLDTTFPTDSCGVCFMSPDPPTLCPSLECGQHPLIDIHPLTTLAALEGEAGAYIATLRTEARPVDPDRCTGCNLCAEVCPEMAISGTEPRGAIYRPEPQAVPPSYVIDWDMCTRCEECLRLCPESAIDFDRQPSTQSLEVSAVILAPGFGPGDANVRGGYGYGHYPNVISSVTYERMLNTSSFSRGNPVRPSDCKPARSIAIIQCVGSRDLSCGASYCSAVCCMIAAKQASLTLRRAPDAQVTVFTMDVRAPGRGCERYLRNVRSRDGIVYHRSLVSGIKRNLQTEELQLQYAEDGKAKIQTVDLVVLDVGMSVPPAIRDMADTAGIALNAYGFARTSDDDPVQTSRKAIFVGGAFREPKDIPSVAAESAAAAAAALTAAGYQHPAFDDPGLPAPGVVVLGNGAAGLMAAHTLSGWDIPVHLIEATDRLGGTGACHMMSDARWLPDLIAKVEESPLITVIPSSQVINFNGEPGHFTVNLETPDGEHTISAGALIVATGAQSHRPADAGILAREDVITLAELSRNMSSMQSLPEQVVMLQCMDTRNASRPYCSKTCCSEALADALVLRQIDPDTRITIVYRDIVTPGFAEALYSEARRNGIRFVRTISDQPPDIQDDRVVVYDDVLGTHIELPFDLLVLSTGIVPAEGTGDLANLLGLGLDEDGFFKAANIKTRPLDLPHPGMFVAGLAGGPASFSEIIEQGMGAALRAALFLRRPLRAPATVASVNARLCRGCGLCVAICPVGARQIDEVGCIAEVDETLCIGCGSCVAICPNGASQQHEYEARSLLMMLDTALVGSV